MRPDAAIQAVPQCGIAGESALPMLPPVDQR
jgi:hypothetical protein